MTDKITEQPEGATPLDDISGLLRKEITTRGQLDEAESLNIVNAVEWIERGRLGDIFTVDFYENLHTRMYDQVWSWAGSLRSVTGARPNIGVPPAMVPMELGRVAMEYDRDWQARNDGDLLPFIARYHHALVSVHPFDNGKESLNSSGLSADARLSLIVICVLILSQSPLSEQITCVQLGCKASKYPEFRSRQKIRYSEPHSPTRIRCSLWCDSWPICLGTRS